MSKSDKVKFEFEVAKRTLFGASCVVTGMLIGMASMAVAFADGDQSTQTVIGSNIVIPYEGFLMRDSDGVSGTQDIIFTLYDETDNALWSERITVTLYAGRFAVGLGTQNSLNSTILDAEQLYIGMTIVETDAAGNETQVALSGKQAIEPAPFAAWSANSADFDVAGDLTVEGASTHKGDSTINGNLGVDGSVSVGGSTALDVTAADALYIRPSRVLEEGRIDKPGDRV